MKNTIPLPLIFFALAVVATAGYFASKHSKTTSPQNTSVRTHRTERQIASYDDAFVSFQYPSSFKVRNAITDSKKRRYWGVEYPGDRAHPLWTEIVVSEYLQLEESRNLEAIYKSKDWDAKHVHPPKTVLLNGGKCLTYRLDYGIDDNRVDANGRTRTVQTCTQVENKAHCYADDGRFFEVHAYSGGFCDRQNPDPETEEKLKAYNALLHSLTIKPVS